MADHSQKTEAPSPRRIQKAREEGRFPTSRHFPSALQFLAFTALSTGFGGVWLEGFRRQVRALIGLAFQVGPEGADALSPLRQALGEGFSPLLWAGAALTAAPLGAHLVVTRFGFSLQRLQIDLSRLGPGKRLMELPSQNIAAFVQSLVLLPVFGLAVWAVVAENLGEFLALPLAAPAAGFSRLVGSAGDLLWRASAVFVLLGLLDLFRQGRRYWRGLRMSRQEIREELKQAEGDPQIRNRIRRLRRDLLRRRMMKEVSSATAVVVNPTHYAVAIRYQPEAAGAPRVVAKGKNFLAQRIRRRAVESQVPIVENPPLAQSLYRSVEVGQEIPPHLYRAVAEILAYILRLMHGRRQDKNG